MLIGARASMANKLELLMWTCRPEGEYTSGVRGKKKLRRAYSRALIAKVHLYNGVAFTGSVQVVMVVHMHHLLANGTWPSKLDPWWDWVHDQLLEFKVDVLMGDFNMSVFELVPRLRSRGVEVAVAGWYPWKSPTGLPCADSCGIFFINKPGKYDVQYAANAVHDNHPGGVLSKDKTGLTQDVDGKPTVSPFDRHNENGGPGIPIKTFLPKLTPCATKLLAFLKPSDACVAEVKKACKGGQNGSAPQCVQGQGEALAGRAVE